MFTPHARVDPNVGLPHPWYGLLVMFLRVRVIPPLPPERNEGDTEAVVGSPSGVDHGVEGGSS